MGLILLLPGEGGRLVCAFAVTQITRAATCSCPLGRYSTAFGRGSVTTLTLTKAVFLAALLCTFTAYLQAVGRLLFKRNSLLAIFFPVRGKNRCMVKENGT